MSKVIRIKKGLDIPIKGDAEKILQNAPRSETYAVCPPDFHGLTPKLLVQEGDRVKAGTPLFFDKYNEKILFVSPVSGVFTSLIRGEKRRILELRIKPDPIDEYVAFNPGMPDQLDREQLIDLLLKSGLWPGIRQRPYSVIANPAHTPRSIFVSCFHTAPLAADLDFVIQGQEDDFQKGLDVLKRLTDGPVHLGVHQNHTRSGAFTTAKGVQVHVFNGPHPSGNVGTQIAHISPINKGDIVWYTGVQEVIGIGRLFSKGVYDAGRIIALAGSEVLNPRYMKVISGAEISGIIGSNLRREKGINPRIISGDPLTGTKTHLNGYLGFYHDQLSIIPEGDQPELFGWMIPRPHHFSVSRTFPSFLMPWRKYRLNTNIRSGERPFVMTGIYEKVLPMDIHPMQLIKSIMINDIDMMEKLGIYEVAPEDFALCEYVCPSKIEFQEIIRKGLDDIRREFS